MTNDSTNQETNEQPDGGADSPAIRTEKDVNQVEKEGEQTAYKRGNSCDNPIFIKDCKPKGWSKAELIASVAVVLNFIALIATSTSAIQSIRIVNLAKVRDSVSAQQIKDLNRPYLQINYDSFRVAKVNEKLALVIGIRNLGNYPARMTTGRFWVSIDSTTPDNPFIGSFDTATQKPINTYITKEMVEKQLISTQLILTQPMINYFVDGKTYLSFFGEINYINELTKDSAQYRFNTRFDNGDLRTYKLLFNKNVIKQQL